MDLSLAQPGRRADAGGVAVGTHVHTHLHAHVHTAPLAWVHVAIPIQVIIQSPAPNGLLNPGQHWENTILLTSSVGYSYSTV